MRGKDRQRDIDRGVRERGREMKERERERQRYIEKKSMGEMERGNDK